jgi:hypothetical protein
MWFRVDSRTGRRDGATDCETTSHDSSRRCPKKSKKNQRKTKSHLPQLPDQALQPREGVSFVPERPLVFDVG